MKPTASLTCSIAIAFNLITVQHAAAEPIQLGETVAGYTLEDQFGKEHRIEKMPRTVILSFEKSTGAVANEFLAAQRNDYLSQNDAVFIADIARMPGIVTTFIALPRMRRLSYTILLSYDDEFRTKYPVRKTMLTVLHFGEESQVTQIQFIRDPVALQAAIER